MITEALWVAWSL